ncbi:MAG: HDOD domain-containing protein [Candidatus Wallbacteria bacterium]|nr:HDOD domain-containing protein [Candidatus Wallbacteria bacterium]
MLKKAEIIESIKAFPPISSAAVELLPLLQEENVNIVKVIQTIECDPALTSNLLKTVNSAAYSGVRRISSIKEAVIRLGTKNIGQMVMVLSADQCHQASARAYDCTPEVLWEHSLAVAMGCEETAKSLNLNKPHYLFTAGLLHDLGKLVLSTFADVDVSMVQDLAMIQGKGLDEAEQEIHGVDHSELGAALLEKWNFPPEICGMVRFHHQPQKTPDNNVFTHLLKTMDALFSPESMQGGLFKLPYDSVTRIGLTADIVDKIRTGVTGSLEQKKKLFSGKH